MVGVAALMSGQNGLISNDQLAAIGVTRGVHRTAVRQGRLRRVAPDVYASPATPVTLDGGV